MDSTPTTPRIAIACGGTGGHLFPGIAVGRRLVQHGCAVTLLVSPKDVDQQAVKGILELEIVTLPAVALQRGSRLAFMKGFVRSYVAARRIFKSQPHHAALAMGGFTSMPPLLAARQRRARTFLHESNTIPGRANRALSRFVDAAFLGFPEAANRLKTKRSVVTGTPVRDEFQMRDPAECRRQLGLDPSRPVILVMGGSQGAGGINELLIRSLPMIRQQATDWQWLHLTGANDAEKVRAAYANAGLTAVVHPFFARMEQALGAADAAVARSGASSMAEFAATRLPCVLVPLPTAADNHQFFNARAFETAGAARMLEQASATPERLLEHLRALVSDPAARGAMQAALGQLHAPTAAANIAAQILASLPAQLRRNAISASGVGIFPAEERASFPTRVEVSA
jgi:UDP-N-acetylglucosamine--N-acetylmuramyl-(pentapeptide) pyrophosphoryl-undecaprenol N-acetylglucosamine transferase